MDRIARLLFPTHNRTTRRKDMRTLGYAVCFTIFLCIVIGALLYILNIQNRI